MITVIGTNLDKFKYDRSRIVQSLIREAGMPEHIANEIANDTSNTIQASGLEEVPTALIREITNTHLILKGYRNYQKKLTRIGIPLYDALGIDLGHVGEGDNANLQPNAETSHKRKADLLSKEEALLVLPEHLSKLHIDADLHIHDLEYFTTRYFCNDWDARYFFYYGLYPDGTGATSSVAAPAKRPEVAILHLVKALSAAQTNHSGGQGFYNFLTFLAPYMEGLPYDEIEHLMQMFVYEMTQMLVARGGQSTSFNEQLIVKERNGTIRLIPIGELCHRYLKKDGSKNIELEELETISLNKETGEIEWQPITGVHVHIPKSPLVETRLHDGRTVVTTSDHSLFTLDSECNIIELKPSDNPKTILTTDQIPCISGKPFDHDLMFLIGVIIGDGSLADNNNISDSSIRMLCSNDEVRSRITSIVQKYNGGSCNWTAVKHTTQGLTTNFSTTNIPFVTEIGHGANNKQIPEPLLRADTKSLYALFDGLISTDGNINRNRYEFATVSVKLKNQLEFLFNRLGIRYSLKNRMNSSNFKRNYPVWEFVISSKDSQNFEITNTKRQIKKQNDLIEQNHHTFSILKQHIKNETSELLYPFGYAFRSNNRKLKKKDLKTISHLIPKTWSKIQHILPSEVESITNADPEPFVYDISVKNNENFILNNGIVAHNTVFSSVQLSPGIPKIWRDKPIVFKGRVYDGIQAMSRTYGEFEREVRLLFKALMNVMLQGDARGAPFNFPKPEISIEPCFLDEDEFVTTFNSQNPDLPTYQELYELSYMLASKFGTPYFDNQIPEYRGAGEGISCYQCHVGTDTIELPGEENPVALQDLFINLAHDGNPIKTQPDGSEIIMAEIPVYATKKYTKVVSSAKGILRKKYHDTLYTFKSGKRTMMSVTHDHKLGIMTERGFKLIQAQNIELSDKIAYYTPHGNLRARNITTIVSDPTFSGYVYSLIDSGPNHTYVMKTGIVSGNCCAYSFATVASEDPNFENKLYFRNGAHFSMGSKQVITLNLPRLAYRSVSPTEFLEKASELIDNCIEIFEFKETLMQQVIKQKRMPFTAQRPPDPHTGIPGMIATDIKGLVNTIGILGLNEVVEHFTGNQIHETPESTKLGMYLVFRLNQIIKSKSVEKNANLAFARTPAETTCQRFAVADLRSPSFSIDAQRYVKGDLNRTHAQINNKSDLPIYYTNGTHTPITTDIPITDRLACEEKFFPLLDGGNIAHIWLGEHAPNPKGLMDMANNICRNTNIGYFAFTRDLTIPKKSYKR